MGNPGNGYIICGAWARASIFSWLWCIIAQTPANSLFYINFTVIVPGYII